MFWEVKAAVVILTTSPVWHAEVWWRLVVHEVGGVQKGGESNGAAALGIHIEDVGNFKKIVLRDIYGSGARIQITD